MADIKQSDIELEASLIKSLATKTNYDKFYSTLDKEKLIPITDRILRYFGTYYDKYKEDIDWPTFYTEFTQNMSKDLKKDDITYYRETVFPLVRNSQIGNNIYVSLLEREARSKMEQMLVKGFNVETAQNIIQSLKQQSNIYLGANDEDIFKLGSIDISVLDNSNGLAWFLTSLQNGLGSLMPGQFVVVSGDSNTGKSAFCISQATHVFRQLHDRGEIRPILYATSEDTREDLGCRFLSNLYNDKCVGGFEEVITQFDRVSKHFVTNYNNDLFCGMQIRNHKDMFKLRDKIDKLHPSLVIIDMLDTLSESGGHEHLKKAYDEIRGIANDGFPVIGTTQAGDTTYWGEDTEGKPQRKHRKKLGDKDTAGSKFGKQGAAYCQIGLGQDDDMPGIRYITTTKKKRGKHCQATCRLIEEYSLYEELI